MKVISVKFKESGRAYYFDPKELEIKEGEFVIVETARGVECGEVVRSAHEIASGSFPREIKPVIRLADGVDVRRMRQNRADEKATFELCEKRIAAHKLQMKLVDAEYTLDRSKLVFYFTADNRVDFRELVKDLAGQFHTLLDLQKIISALFPALHLIQGCVCPVEQQIIVCHCSIRNRSSQAAGDMQSRFIIIITVRHTVIQLSKLLFQFLSWHILYIAYELVSTNPAFQRLGKQFIHFIRKRAQYRISKQMSVCIVDLFKAIHIQDNKVSHLSPFHFLQSVCDLLLDGGMIQKSGQ